MANLYTERLVGPQAVTNDIGPVTVGTVPTGHRWMITDVTLQNGSAGSSVVIVGIGPANTNANRIYRVVLATVTSVYLNRLRWVLNAGDTLSLNVGTNPCSVSVHGYDLLT